RKFLLAGRGGLNLTHSEPLENLLRRYGEPAEKIRAAVEGFSPSRLIAWADGLGAETFVGSSGRVFPRAMKASPLLRAWLRRLNDLGVVIHTRHRWLGFSSAGFEFETPAGPKTINPDATVFALGGASWPKLGADGGWVEPFAKAGIVATPLSPANCGVVVGWSDVFKARFEGAALKRIALSIAASSARGEAVITAEGLEGGAVYALIPRIRAELAAHRSAVLSVDLKPDVDQATLAQRLSHRRPKETLTNFLRKATHLDAAAVALLREHASALPDTAPELAARIKGLPIRIEGLAALDRAISTAGGVAWEALDDTLMVTSRPGLFVAGEMLDWEAPTGGYLLQATFATAERAAKGLLTWLAERQ
ncbi:MAG: TIGR03862 family flavoprotein, partial [Hyphomicrobium sp.]